MAGSRIFKASIIADLNKQTPKLEEAQQAAKDSINEAGNEILFTFIIPDDQAANDLEASESDLPENEMKRKLLVISIQTSPCQNEGLLSYLCSCGFSV